jgi:Ala-tRNA(Pro) deacylase
MPIPKRVLNFLEKTRVKHEVIEHRTVYTAFDKVQTLKVPGKIVGKTLVLKINGSLVLVSIPANKNLDKNKFKRIFKKKKIDFAKELLIKNRIKGVKVGAIPPFGNLWNLPTFVDKTLLKERKIIFNGGDYRSSIKIRPVDFKKLIPDLVIGSFSRVKK